jgi:hypothetical protein
VSTRAAASRRRRDCFRMSVQEDRKTILPQKRRLRKRCLPGFPIGQPPAPGSPSESSRAAHIVLLVVRRTYPTRTTCREGSVQRENVPLSTIAPPREQKTASPVRLRLLGQVAQPRSKRKVSLRVSPRRGGGRTKAVKAQNIGMAMSPQKLRRGGIRTLSTAGSSPSTFAITTGVIFAERSVTRETGRWESPGSSTREKTTL